MGKFRNLRKICQKCQQSYHRGHFYAHNCSTSSRVVLGSLSPVNQVENDYNNQQDTLNEDILDDSTIQSTEELSEVDECGTDAVFFTESDESECSMDEAIDKQISISKQNASINLLLQFFLIKWQSIFKISNTAMGWLLKFFKIFLQLISKIPLTISTHYKLQQVLNTDVTSFEKFVVCGKCHKLYDFSDCLQTVEGKQESRRCKNILFPNHNQRGRRTKCNNVLLQQIQTPTGKLKFRPVYEYCYRSLALNLQELFTRPNTMDLCAQWQKRKTYTHIMQDIYDGKVWKEYEKLGFFKDNHDLAFLLNCDFFQPFDRTSYSVGVLYLVLLNLPRHERYKKENIMVIGVLPHLGKEPSTLNTFLAPLVEELRIGYNVGLQLNTHNSPSEKEFFRTILLCVSCDIPATRKVCGFLSHSARLGCSKCLKEFKFDENGKQCCGDFNHPIGKRRTNAEHRKNVAYILKNGITATRKKELESHLGVRDSELLKLPYLDIVRCHAIDSMHNLMTGSSKKLMVDWIASKTITSRHLEEMQEEIIQFVVPSKIGRMPFKIITGMATFTAEEWRNWVTIFSSILLKHRLPEEDYQIWKTFVRAFVLICKKSISQTEVMKAHELFIQFGKECEKKYGSAYITPNMHLHLHLAQTVLDYGLVYATWCFSLERMNGLMGKQSRNCKHIEQRIMARLLRELHVTGKEFADEDLPKDFSDLLLITNNLGSTSNQQETILESGTSLSTDDVLSSRFVDIQKTDWSLKNHGTLNNKSTTINLENYDLKCLEEMYQFLYPDKTVLVSRLAESYKKINYGWNTYGCKRSGSHSSSFIMAYWCGANSSELSISNLRPGQVIGLYKQEIVINQKTKVHFIAKVEWFREVSGDIKHKFGAPTAVYSELHEEPGIANWIPIQRIKCHCACIFRKENGFRVIITTPIIQTMQ